MGIRLRTAPAVRARRPDYISEERLIETIGNYEGNAFVSFLLDLFPFDRKAVDKAIAEYLIGTKDGFTVFPTISKNRKFCKAKLMKFDPTTGNRIKDGHSISSLQARLKRSGQLGGDFETDKDVFFGEHLLRKYERSRIAIVESEKTAIVATIFKSAFPENLVWLGAHSKSWLNVERLRRIGRDREILLYPDADAFERWKQIAADAARTGITVRISRLIDNKATKEEKEMGFDLADYLIDEVQKMNEYNASVVHRNAERQLCATDGFRPAVLDATDTVSLITLKNDHQEWFRRSNTLRSR